MSDATSVLSVTTRKPSIQESQDEDKDPTKRAEFCYLLEFVKPITFSEVIGEAVSDRTRQWLMIDR